MPLALALAVGCSQQDFGRPVTGMFSGSRPKSGGASGAVDASARAERLARVLAEWNAGKKSSREYHLGAEDVLEIGVGSLEEVGKTTRISRPVQEDGAVVLPLAGAVRVVGLTVPQAEAAMKAALDGRYIQNPEVTVVVSEYRSVPIVMTGAVNKPGVYYLKNDRRSVLEMLAEADGLSAAAGNEALLIRSAEATTNAPSLVTIDLRRLIDGGDLRLNAWVTRGDMLTVPPRTKEYVYVLGYVQRPGVFEIDRDDPPSALQAVAFAGGLSSTARAENSFVLRETETGQKMIPVDLTGIARGKSQVEFMRPGDTLVVGSSFVARLSEFVRPSVSAGMSYSPAP